MFARGLYLVTGSRPADPDDPNNGAQSWAVQRVAEGDTTYAYDVFGRVTSVTTADGTWAYEYDAMGHRRAAVHDGLGPARRHALHLAAAMTYKYAVVGFPRGGGKARGPR